MSRFVIKDHYFERAKKEGYKARSVFKLEEIDQRIGILKKGSIVLDLGSAPGSWLQYIAKKIGPQGAALGVDLTPISEKFHKRIITICDDCFSLSKEKISDSFCEISHRFCGFDAVLSDMAPKTTGMKHVDQTRSLELAFKALDLAEEFLKPGGHVVIKVFDSQEVKNLLAEMKKIFFTVKQMRPKSVRAPSKESYVVGIKKK